MAYSAAVHPFCLYFLLFFRTKQAQIIEKVKWNTESLQKQVFQRKIFKMQECITESYVKKVKLLKLLTSLSF